MRRVHRQICELLHTRAGLTLREIAELCGSPRADAALHSLRRRQLVIEDGFIPRGEDEREWVYVLSDAGRAALGVEAPDDSSQPKWMRLSEGALLEVWSTPRTVGEVAELLHRTVGAVALWRRKLSAEGRLVEEGTEGRSTVWRAA